MMGTLLLLGGMLMMLTPVTSFYTGLDMSSMGHALRKFYNPEADIPADMLETLQQLD